ncbi:hypothetical protein ACFZC5_36020 [Nocardia gamkensis]|uniref:hypothetical protein n=1 Tax=Nocardia gamkensis TaxID=352869 RepID=UPI0036E6E43E
MRAECLNRNRWTSLLEVRMVLGDFKVDHNLRHRHQHRAPLPGGRIIGDWLPTRPGNTAAHDPRSATRLCTKGR